MKGFRPKAPRFGAECWSGSKRGSIAGGTTGLKLPDQVKQERLLRVSFLSQERGLDGVSFGFQNADAICDLCGFHLPGVTQFMNEIAEVQRVLKVQLGIDAGLSGCRDEEGARRPGR